VTGAPPSLRAPLAEALTAVLHRTAFFAEAHAVKALLSIGRVADRHGLDDSVVAEALGIRQLLDAPAVEGLISRHVGLDFSSLDRQRLAYMTNESVFPAAYGAAVEWEGREGIEAFLAHFQPWAIARFRYLGHGWTIWCSFVEIAAHLETPLQRSLLAERMAELIAVQRHPPPALDGDTPEEKDALIAALLHPGFYGHTAITAGYMLRHRARFETDEWNRALRGLLHMAQNSRSWDAPLEITLALENTELSESVLQSRVLRGIDQAPGEVHTWTLLDALHDLWDTGSPDIQRAVLRLADWLADLRIERTETGERKA
jgi:hypothetical protein